MRRNMNLIVFSIIIASAIPLLLYFRVFHGGFSSNDQNWSNFGSYIGGIVSSIFSCASFIILIMNYINDKENDKERIENEKNEKYKNVLVQYLKYVNIFNYEINHLITNIVNIHKYSIVMMGEPIYSPYNIGIDKNFYNIVNRITKLCNFIISNANLYNQKNTNKKVYYDLIIKGSNEICDPNAFIDIAGKFEMDACNYFYRIDRPLRNEYKDIIKTIRDSSQKGMIYFDLEAFKKKLIYHIYSINEEIMDKKLDRTKDLFDDENV